MKEETKAEAQLTPLKIGVDWIEKQRIKAHTEVALQTARKCADLLVHFGLPLTAETIREAISIKVRRIETPIGQNILNPNISDLQPTLINVSYIYDNCPTLQKAWAQRLEEKRDLPPHEFAAAESSITKDREYFFSTLQKNWADLKTNIGRGHLLNIVTVDHGEVTTLQDIEDYATEQAAITLTTQRGQIIYNKVEQICNALNDLTRILPDYNNVLSLIARDGAYHEPRIINYDSL